MSDNLIAKTDTVPYLAAHLAEGGTANVGLVDEFGQSAAVNIKLTTLVRFARDVLTRVREAGTDVPPDGGVTPASPEA